jgi:hypothetical protein
MPLPFFLHGQHNSDTLSCLVLLPYSWRVHCTLNSSETGEGTCYTCQTASKEERGWIGIQGCTLPLQGNILVHERTSNHHIQSKVKDPISVLASISQPPKGTIKHSARHSNHSMIRDPEAEYPQHACKSNSHVPSGQLSPQDRQRHASLFRETPHDPKIGIGDYFSQSVRYKTGRGMN